MIYPRLAANLSGEPRPGIPSPRLCTKCIHYWLSVFRNGISLRFAQRKTMFILL
ncbi:uncharacterized protein PHALS_02927 [Plasmopara halstedii]|uniref:Uncharacterized protein n=1 Tax=Plasmopara halstedii TaxID=4781 RepID=A0A0P1AVV8_PLAHL|nr:uncharacterized protein PHALS_02927 [Plasmopara halstedii]CEG46527.1 hypothetical protein PHALS_02927 [Plasmopara halstedii]|eukprot:XP_024582896.1 hypothetical protein PHALS_02927 [Plasmopara halstedii]